MPRPAQSASRLKRFLAILLIAAIAAAVALGFTYRERGSVAPDPMRNIGLFTSLPILWNEYGEISELLKPEGESHWAVAVLRQRGQIRPLDRIAPMPDDLGVLVMAQPRPLSPDENVAIDEWVRGGGKVLLFADPMLTQQSAFSIGDRRRPEDMAMLSPILTRWGLTLQFDEAQPAGERTLDVLGEPMPVNLSGSFAVSGNAEHCRLYADGLAARCRVGKGMVLAVADAALLEPRPDGESGDRAAGLQALLDDTLDN